MASAPIEWVPASAAELTDRRRLVRTTDEPDITIETILFGIGAVLVPVAIIVGVPQPIGTRAAFALVFGSAMLTSFLFSRHGLYLSRSGVRVWRGVLPRPTIPWSEIEAFCLGTKRVDLGRHTVERLVVRCNDGTALMCWFLNRRTTFESDVMPVASAKDRFRSFPDLVEQLNRIRGEIEETG